MLKLAVLGNPIAHSRSPELHQAFARQVDLRIDYQKILVPEGAFEQTVQAFIKAGGVGFNVTAPCKGDAFLLARTCSQRALLAHAVNTLVINPDGSCYGDNTDGAGLLQDLIVNKNFNVVGKNIVIHGAGGAVRGIIPALLAQKPQQLWLMNRHSQKALDLATYFTQLGPIQAVAYGTALAKIDLLIDGSSGACQNFNGLAKLQFNANALAYDLKYADHATAFMMWAESVGIQRCHDGFGMLVEQAALSFQLWTGSMPDTPFKMRG